MYRIASCLASLAMISLPACKRDRGGPSDPDSTTEQGSTASQTPTPTPEQVCTRLSEIAAARLGPVDPEIQRDEVRLCIDDMILVQQVRGPEGWDGVARCVVAAQSEADINRCDQLHPAPADANADANASAPEGVTPEDQVCVLMISTLAIELAAQARAAGQPAPELADADLRAAHSDCLGSLEQARQIRSAPEYDSLLACLAAADSSPKLDQCLGQ
jgi:hypothetical protein